MKVFGLTGNTGTGKTTVARGLGDRGVGVVDADAIARQIVEPGQPALAAIAQTFGEAYLDEAGHLRRQALGRLIFGDVEAKRRLERITHPRIAAEAQRQLAAHRAAGTQEAVYDSAILVETGLAAAFDGLIVVTADREQQLRRIVERDGLSEGDAQQRIDAQMRLADKVAVADYVVDNSGTLAELDAQLDELLDWMRALDVRN